MSNTAVQPVPLASNAPSGSSILTSTAKKSLLPRIPTSNVETRDCFIINITAHCLTFGLRIYVLGGRK